MEKIVSLFSGLFEEGKENEFLKVIFSNVRKKSNDCKKVVGRPVLLKEKFMIQSEYHFEKKVTHENLTVREFINTALRLIEEEFKQINIQTRTEDIQILAAKPENPRIVRKKRLLAERQQSCHTIRRKNI